MEVREARPEDSDGMYAVCLRTAAAGEDGTSLFTNPRLVGDNFTGPYLPFDGARCWVLADGDAILGYSISVPDSRAFDAYFNDQWAPPLRRLYPVGGAGSDTLTADDRWMIERLHRPLRTDDDLYSRYPAHGHIDIVPEGQGHGFGRILMDNVMSHAQQAGAHGIHLDVSPLNVRARGFYAHLGFEQGPVIDDVSYLVRSL